jgi:hypothetical protein
VEGLEGIEGKQGYSHRGDSQLALCRTPAIAAGKKATIMMMLFNACANAKVYGGTSSEIYFPFASTRLTKTKQQPIKTNYHRQVNAQHSAYYLT